MENKYDAKAFKDGPEVRARLRARREKLMDSPEVLDTLARVEDMQRLTAEDLSLVVT